MKRSIAVFCSVLGMCFVASSAQASPSTLLFEGVLSGNAGAPAADGLYNLSFSLYAKVTDPKALWTETAVGVSVKGGSFQHPLGSVKALSNTVLDSAQLVGVRVGSEPELPRVALHAVAFARQAATAKSLSCTGCVSISALLFDGDVNLANNSMKANNGIFSGNLVAKTVSAQSFVGDGSKLTGLTLPKGACKAGSAVSAINADGTLKCIEIVGGGELSTLTGGLLTSRLTSKAQFDATAANAIPDNTGKTLSATANVTEPGSIEKVTVTVGLKNSDLSAIRLQLLPPDDKQKGIMLCDPCGAKNAKTLSLSWPPAKEKSGALASYIGKSAKGTWTLNVLDSAFCIPQIAGNAALCDVKNATDGSLSQFEVAVEVLSNNTVSVPGTLVAGSALHLPSVPNPTPPCGLKSKGSTYLDAANGQLLVCDGADWRTLKFGQACGNKIVSGDEQCDDGNNDDSDACLTTCKKAICGDGKIYKGQEVCDDGNTKDGDACSADCQKQLGKQCSNGSTTDCNPNGQTLVKSSVFVDQNPPNGWVQCMGFINTNGNDVGPDAMNNCLNTKQMRLRIYDGGGKLVVDVYETGLNVGNSWWNGGKYFDGGNNGPSLQLPTCGSLWPCNNTAGFYGSRNGFGGGGCNGYANGMTLSNGNGGQITVAPGQTDAKELWKGPCYGGTTYVNYKIAVYK